MRNYLRVRGEYSPPSAAHDSSAELPPRARRIPYYNHTGRPEYGTTSACAENTRPAAIPLGCRGNYLRVRGEYLPGRVVKTSDAELPPRARRILAPRPGRSWADGTTSACAENTRPGQVCKKAAWNYLRVRGEY